ncbi:MAG: lamin tail domain-containing protein, partial [Actinomycetia bacterium]|nr:lamin tail domain-containing protein [Actinomycetes bacterium]
DAVDLSGWSISDDHGETGKHRLEQIVIEPWGRVLLWADGEPGLGPDHLGFTLNADGGQIGVYAPTGQPVDGLTFGRQATDHAAARVLDGDAEWVITASPSPGAYNGGTGEGWGGDWPEPPQPCELVSDIAQLNYLEGDRVTLEARCGGPLGTAASLELVAPPQGASWDGERFEWTTGPTSGGRIDLVFQVTTQGVSGELPSAEAVTFWVADDPSAVDNVAPEATAYTEEWGLPVLHAYTWSEIGDGYVAAELTFDGNRYAAQIKVRGATSSNYPKPGYTIELAAAELDIPAWGVTRDHLVLLSPFDDNAYVFRAFNDNIPYAFKCVNSNSER